MYPLDKKKSFGNILSLVLEQHEEAFVTPETKFSWFRSFLSTLKAQGHLTVNKPVFSMIYVVAHTLPLCSAQILVDGVNPQ